MAFSTPAQKPRGAARTTLSTFTAIQPSEAILARDL